MLDELLQEGGLVLEVSGPERSRELVDLVEPVP